MSWFVILSSAGVLIFGALMALHQWLKGRALKTAIEQRQDQTEYADALDVINALNKSYDKGELKVFRTTAKTKDEWIVEVANPPGFKAAEALTPRPRDREEDPDEPSLPFAR